MFQCIAIRLTHFFDRAIAQHSKVYSVTRIYDEMFEAEQKNRSVKIALVETYNMSAEDVRFARARFGKFDVARQNYQLWLNNSGCPSSGSLDGRRGL